MRQLTPPLIALLLGFISAPASTAAPAFRAGADAVDISPLVFPVRVNAMFTERSATNVTDALSDLGECLLAGAYPIQQFSGTPESWQLLWLSLKSGRLKNLLA